MLQRLLSWLFGAPGASLSARDKSITTELRCLATLRCEHGRVSIDPSEVLTEQYLVARRDAVRLLTRNLRKTLAGTLRS